jgi:hypothetical protein
VGSPFDEGCIAARAGMDESANPYEEGTDAFSDWLAGFRQEVDILGQWDPPLTQ